VGRWVAVGVKVGMGVGVRAGVGAKVGTEVLRRGCCCSCCLEWYRVHVRAKISRHSSGDRLGCTQRKEVTIVGTGLWYWGSLLRDFHCLEWLG
jgi:hypothetical protein